MSQHTSSNVVQHVAKLANLPVSVDEAAKLAQAFDETLAVVEKLKTVDVSNVKPTFQVTGLENVTREDKIDTTSMFSQPQALANAHQSADGYFMVPAVLDRD